MTLPLRASVTDQPVLPQIVNAIREVVGKGLVVLHEPYFAGNEWRYVKECLDSTFVSSVGAFVGRFESELDGFTGAKYAIAVVYGTAFVRQCQSLDGPLHSSTRTHACLRSSG